MALIKCRECGREVSSSAKTCPGCGIKDPQPMQPISAVAFVAIAILVFFLLAKALFSSPPQPSPSSAPIPRTAVELREEKIRSGFSSWDGSHIGLEKIIKQSMHNPDSYKHVKTTYIEDGNELTVATQYRGTNSFGGVVTSQVIAKTDLDGNVIKILSQGK
mgnify:CR=1 FL=1